MLPLFVVPPVPPLHLLSPSSLFVCPNHLVFALESPPVQRQMVMVDGRCHCEYGHPETKPLYDVVYIQSKVN